MFGLVSRSWRSWRAKARLLAPMHAPLPRRFLSRDLRFPELSDPSGGRRELPPYQGLSEVWDDCTRPTQPDYLSFLRHLARERGAGFGSVLELACGTGTLTEQLAAIAPVVVGLDSSEAMLAQARIRCANHPRVALAHADFRTFEFDNRFDAVVCGSNSLNYVANAEELAQVFQRVARHLRTDGVFVFDVQTEAGMRAVSGLYHHVEADGRRFALRFKYDPHRRAEVSVALVPGGVETHRRTPINPPDVTAAVRGSSLRVDDYFASPLFPGWWDWGWMCFFVLSRKGE